MKKKISAFLASMLLLGSIGGVAMAEGMTPGEYRNRFRKQPAS